MNFLWLFLGGWASAIAWFTASLIMFISIIGIPWGRAAFNIAVLNLWPFGSEIQIRKTKDVGTGPLGFIGNIIWFIFAGWWLMAYHLVIAILFGITIIGIPFAIQHFKIAALCVSPIGKKIKLEPNY